MISVVDERFKKNYVVQREVVGKTAVTPSGTTVDEVMFGGLTAEEYAIQQYVKKGGLVGPDGQPLIN